MRTRRAPGAAVVLAVIALLLASAPGHSVAAAGGPKASPRPPLVPAAEAPGGPIPAGPSGASASPPAPELPAQPSPATLYDEQMGLTFTHGFVSMLYNVTAVPQSDPASGTGPAYLLNGLTTSGYWYQVGVSWDWSPGEGFAMNYEVFGPSGDSIFPTSGGSGLLQFNGAVTPGDSIALNLYFKSGEVVMLAEDRNTSAYAVETYSAEGATSFVGSPSSTANAEGFFTGLMTEWYHGAAYFGDQDATEYSSALAQTSAWMWIDEFSCSASSCTTRTSLFSASTEGPVYYFPPTQLIRFSSHGATELSDAYDFFTGTLNRSTVALTVGYSVVGGGTYLPPVFSYVQGGTVRTASLTSTPSTYLVDLGSTWNVTGVLPGSGPEERWATANASSGVAAASQTLSFVFYHQYLASLQAVVVGGGTGYALPAVGFMSFGLANSMASGTTAWVDAGTNATFPATLAGSTQQERWVAADPVVQAVAPGPLTETYVNQYAVTVTAFPAPGGEVTPGPGWFDAGETVSLGAVASQGWEFQGWAGSGAGAYSGGAASATLAVDAPLNESALFFPGLTITSGPGGTVAYSYHGKDGEVAGGSRTVYAPAGTEVDLTAEASFLHVFSGWAGGTTSRVETVVLSGPTAVEGSFGYDYPALWALGSVAAAVLVSVLAVALRRKPAAARRALP
ncbi:MAG: hypothetical protein JRM85_00925 [Nitrososphaerota archaeon]|nr:hypothetical protein [Nitrososphaerota archaeon]MDG6919571.1 hypothetical protein [Nitrososphaerota archaeon]MDG6946097.1 hypothetical protein [Nitrososphaerota archaeon]